MPPLPQLWAPAAAGTRGARHVGGPARGGPGTWGARHVGGDAGEGRMRGGPGGHGLVGTSRVAVSPYAPSRVPTRTGPDDQRVDPAPLPAVQRAFPPARWVAAAGAGTPACEAVAHPSAGRVGVMLRIAALPPRRRGAVWVGMWAGVTVARRRCPRDRGRLAVAPAVAHEQWRCRPGGSGRRWLPGHWEGGGHCPRRFAASVGCPRRVAAARGTRPPAPAAAGARELRHPPGTDEQFTRGGRPVRTGSA
jgi:hypothetical protein